MYSNSQAVLSLAFILAAPACGPNNDVRPIGESVSAGKMSAIGPDQPDNACRIVLRRARPQFGIKPNGTPVCGTNGCHAIVDVDVASSLYEQPGFQKVELAFAGSDGAWKARPAFINADPVMHGFMRYTFQIPIDVQNGSELIPFVTIVEDGVTQRYWDHNVHSGNYTLDHKDAYTIRLDLGTCAPSGPYVRFKADGREIVEGKLQAGEGFYVEYELSRMTTCRGYKYGAPAWSMTAYVRFNTSGEIHHGAVAGGGYAGGQHDPMLAYFEIPKGASHMEMWVHNSDYWACSDWDSLGGQNYHFDIAAN